MDFAKAFGFVFEDEDWIKKVLIGGAIMLIPGIGQLLAFGYGMEIIRRVVTGHPQLLPEWDDWGTKLVQGLMAGVAGFVWALPLILFATCVWIVPALVFGLDEDAGNIAITCLAGCVGLVSLVYGLALAFILPAALARYAVTGEFGAVFRLGEVISLVRSNLSTYLMVLLITVVAQFIGGLGSIVLVCGALFTGFYAVLVTYYAYGEAYRVAAGTGEAEESLAY